MKTFATCICMVYNVFKYLNMYFLNTDLTFFSIENHGYKRSIMQTSDRCFEKESLRLYGFFLVAMIWHKNKMCELTLISR
jgi:hypothetical protein